jgi:hypothetical protein
MYLPYIPMHSQRCAEKNETIESVIVARILLVHGALSLSVHENVVICFPTQPTTKCKLLRTVVRGKKYVCTFDQAHHSAQQRDSFYSASCSINSPNQLLSP